MNRLAVAVLAALAALLFGGWTHGIDAVKTADPQASQATQNVLLYFKNVGRRATHRVVTGQYFASAQCCSPAELPAAGWAANIAALYTATGAYPGIIGADYNDASNTPPFDVIDYTILNSYLKTAATGGSIITVGWHARNPFVDSYWSDTRCNGGTLADLVNPATTVTVLGTSTSVYTAWHNQLAAVAAGLRDLQAAGITVLWRPLLEQNTSPWWFMSCNQNMAQFQALWADMFNTLTTTYGLHNLLWVYSSNGPWTNIIGCPGVQGESGLCLYPGGAYVDVVGLDDYRDTVGPMPDSFADNWQAWRRFGKVLAQTERGPSSASDPNGMYARLIPGFVANAPSPAPAVAFFQAWAGTLAIAASSGASTLMSDPNAANQSDVKRALDCMNAATNYAARVACVLAP